MRGTGFFPDSAAYVYYDSTDSEVSADRRIRIPVRGNGSFVSSDGNPTGPFQVVPPNRPVPVYANDLGGSQVLATWEPCPPPTTTTTTTTRPPPPTTAAPPTTNTSPTTTAAPATTTSTTAPRPPASLVVTPVLGPGGFVTSAEGRGFPPGAVSLSWDPGIGGASATAGPDGTFQVPVLVMPRDRNGPRQLVATGAGGVRASADFLVVPSTVQPSGDDVTQIRNRRLVQR